MVRVLPVLAALAVAAVVLAPAGAAAVTAVSPSTTQVSTPNGSVVLPAQLWAGTTAKSDLLTAHTDIGLSTDTAGAVTEARFFELRLQQQLAEAETPAERRSVLTDSADQLGDRSEALLSRERAAYGAYTTGEIDAQTLVRRLTRIAATADRYRETADELLNEVEATPRMPVPDSLTTASDELQALRAPVLQQLAAVARGDQAASPVRVSVSDDRLRLAMIDHEERKYLVDTYDWSNWQRGGDRPFTLGNVEEVATEFANRYPWMGEEVRWIEELRPTTIGAYEVGAVESYATMTVWFDSQSTQVYLEHQELKLGTLPTQLASTATADSVRLRVARTDTGGPALIETAATATGTPVNATIRLDDQVAGTTGSDGRLWVIPSSDESNVTAQTSDESINTSVVWSTSEG